MNDLTVTTQAQLPTTAENLSLFIIIGKERLIAQKAKIRAIEKANMAVAAKEAALSDAQDMADILLDAEVKLGEILEPLADPTASREGRRQLPPDITHKQSHQAQTLSKNRDIVEQAKSEAREAGEIPTASRVYSIIKDKPDPVKAEDSDAKREFLRPKIPEHAIYFAEIAISQLERISNDDPTRDEAFDRVIKWINQHRKGGKGNDG